MKAAYLIRHAAIYVNDYDYEEYIEPFISKLANHTGSTGIDWSKIPSLNFLSSWTAPITEAEQELSVMAQISAIPTLMAFRDGILVFRQPGALPAAALEQVIDKVRELEQGIFAYLRRQGP